MGNFKQHITYGWYAHILTTISITPILTYLNLPLQLIAAIIGISIPLSLFGSIIPDIDHPASKTYRIFKYIILQTTIIISIIIISNFETQIMQLLSQIIPNVKREISLLVIIIMSIITSIIVSTALSHIRPPHRGITHRIHFGIILSTILFIIVFYLYNTLIHDAYNYITSLTITIYFFIGFNSHLYRDGILKQ